jgi:hypothetical protein
MSGHEEKQLLALGKMVFGMMTDVVLMPQPDEAYARRTVTMPNGKGGKHSIELIVASAGVADVMEAAAAAHFDVHDAPGSKGGAPQ